MKNGLWGDGSPLARFRSNSFRRLAYADVHGHFKTEAHVLKSGFAPFHIQFSSWFREISLDASLACQRCHCTSCAT